MQLFRAQKDSCTAWMRWFESTSGRGAQQGAPGEAVVRDGQPALDGGQAGQAVHRVLEKLESSSTTLRGQMQSTARVKEVEPRKCSTCH